MEKIKVSRSASNKVNVANVFTTIIGWLSVIIGAVLLLDSALSGAISPIIGTLCITGGLSVVLMSVLFGALYPITRASELYNSINERLYEIEETSTEDEDVYDEELEEDNN